MDEQPTLAGDADMRARSELLRLLMRIDVPTPTLDADSEPPFRFN